MLSRSHKLTNLIQKTVLIWGKGQVEAVYRRQNSYFLPIGAYRQEVSEEKRSEGMHKTLKLLNEVLANIRLIYLPSNYKMSSICLSRDYGIGPAVNEHFNALATSMLELAQADYDTPLADKMANFQLLINQLPGAANRSLRNLGISLLLLALLSVCLIIVIANPSIAGIVASKHALEMTLLFMTALLSFVGSFGFFIERAVTPELAQAVSELPSPQMTL